MYWSAATWEATLWESLGGRKLGDGVSWYTLQGDITVSENDTSLSQCSKYRSI